MYKTSDNITDSVYTTNLSFIEYDKNFPDVKILSREFFQKTNNNLQSIIICHQGINWNNLPNNRELLRKHRLAHHEGHRNTLRTQLEKHEGDNFFVKTTNDIFYQYKKFIKEIPISIQHFQLRKNLKLINQNEIVYIRTFGIEKLNCVNFKRKFLVLFDGEETEHSSKVVCFDIHYSSSDGIRFICCGKMNGYIILYTLFNNSVTAKMRKKVSDEGELQITNKVQFIENGSKLLTCSNDGNVNIYQISEHSIFTLIKKYTSVSAINDCAINFTNNILATVGDFETVDIFDFRTTELIMKLNGHKDYGFSVSFQESNEYTLASGNQDYNCKIWDLRGCGKCVKTLHGHFDSIGQIAFTQSKILYSENTDFLHIYDFNKNTLQSMDYFGSSAGFIFDDNLNRIYLALYEHSYPGLMIYDKIINSEYSLNSLII